MNRHYNWDPSIEDFVYVDESTFGRFTGFSIKVCMYKNEQDVIYLDNLDDTLRFKYIEDFKKFIKLQVFK